MEVPEPKRGLFGEVVFSVGSEDYTWEDVIRAAQSWGDWDRLRGRAREGIACLRGLDDEEEDPFAAEEVESAANEFRYARDLVSAEEMEAWLGKWGLTAEGWMDWIRSSLLRRKWSERMPELLSEYPAAEEEVERLLLTEAVYSGDLARLAYELAGRAAIRQKENERPKEEDSVRASEEPEPPATADRSDGFTRLEESFRRFRERVLRPGAIDAKILSRRTDWTRLDVQSVTFLDREAAREAALCVSEDGEKLEEVAGDANREIRRERIAIEDADSDLRGLFLGARKGELLGPIKSGEEYVLYFVLDKVLPSRSDAEIAARAEKAVVEGAVEREINDRVKWHIAL